MSISLEDVERVARLARLRLSPTELVTMQEQLSRILDYMTLLEELDLTNVPPTAQATEIANVLRSDVVRPSLPREEVLLNANDQQDGMFRIHAVFDE